MTIGPKLLFLAVMEHSFKDTPITPQSIKEKPFTLEEIEWSSPIWIISSIKDSTPQK